VALAAQLRHDFGLMLTGLVLMLMTGVAPPLAQGRALFQALHYEEALVQLAAATRDPHLTGAEAREAFDLLARTQAALGDLSAAEATFAELLTRDAAAPAPLEASPKIREAFRAARARVFPLGTVRLTRRGASEGRLVLELFDPWAAVARVELRQVGGGQVTSAAPAPALALTVPPGLVAGFVVALGPTGEVLGTLGSSTAPLRLGRPPAPSPAPRASPGVGTLLAQGRDDEALELVQQSKDLGRQEVLQALRAEACAAARTGDVERATAAWRRLFVVSAKVAPPDECEAAWSSWFNARSWSRAQPPLVLVTRAASTDLGWRASVTRRDDVLDLVQRARFHLRKVGGWAEQTVAFVGDTAEVTDEGVLAWWVEILAATGVMRSVGSLQEPLAPKLSDAPASVQLTVPAAAPPPPATASLEYERRPAWRLPTVVTTGVLGVLALGFGIWFGLLARADQSTLEGLPRQVTALTQVQAVALAQRQRLEAGGANGLFAAAGVFAVTSALVFFLVREPERGLP
jgi:hypothetical protein